MTGTAGTARELYRVLLRDEVAPRLRALGWKGSGLRFRLPDAGAWVQLGFRSSRHGAGAPVRFTFHVSVVGRAAWEEYRTAHPEAPARPGPTIAYGPAFRPVRIGHLMAVARDSWWLVREGDTPEQTAATADSVCAAVTGTAVPEIRRRLAQLAAPAADGIPG